MLISNMNGAACHNLSYFEGILFFLISYQIYELFQCYLKQSNNKPEIEYQRLFYGKLNLKKIQSIVTEIGCDSHRFLRERGVCAIQLVSISFFFLKNKYNFKKMLLVLLLLIDQKPIPGERECVCVLCEYSYIPVSYTHTKLVDKSPPTIVMIQHISQSC